MLQDVTGFRQAQSALIENEELFRSLVSNINSGILIYQGLKLKYINNSAEIITGYSKEEMFDMDFLDIVHQDYWQVFEGQQRSILSDGNQQKGHEIKIISKNSDIRWIDIRSSNIKYKGKRGGMFTFFDITDRKLVEKAMKESEEKFHLIFTQSPLGIGHYDNDSCITECNEKFAQILGFSVQGLIGMNILRNLKDEKLKIAIKKSLSGNAAFYEDYYSSLTSPVVTPIKMSCSSIEDSDGNVLLEKCGNVILMFM